jgi:hypothetical protein
MQIADSRVKFNRSPRPAGRALGHPASAFHLLVVSQPGIFHKGRWTADGPRHVRGGGSAPRAVSARGRRRHQIRADTSTHSSTLPPGISMGRKREQARKSRRLVRQPQPKDNARRSRSSRSTAATVDSATGPLVPVRAAGPARKAAELSGRTRAR